MASRKPFEVSFEGEIELSDVVYRLLAAELLDWVRKGRLDVEAKDKPHREESSGSDSHG